MSSVEDRPATWAGIQDGDELVEVNGTSFMKHLTIIFQELHSIK